LTKKMKTHLTARSAKNRGMMSQNAISATGVRTAKNGWIIPKMNAPIEWRPKMKCRQRDPAELDIKIQVDIVALQKLWLWAEMASGEISSLGLVEEIRDENTGRVSILRVTDFFLVKQSCSVAETTMDPKGVAELMTSLEGLGVDSSKLRCWAHSHGAMGVFWSDTDDECITGLANGEWLLSLVVNKKRDSLMRLDQFHPTHLYLGDVVWEVHYPLIDGIAEHCVAEFRAKVEETPLLIGNGKSVTVQHVDDLRSAHERGVLTAEELQEEMEWLGLHEDEFDELQPF
jgi:hypothetical protein